MEILNFLKKSSLPMNLLCERVKMFEKRSKTECRTVIRETRRSPHLSRP